MQAYETPVPEAVSETGANQRPPWKLTPWWVRGRKALWAALSGSTLQHVSFIAAGGCSWERGAPGARGLKSSLKQA